MDILRRIIKAVDPRFEDVKIGECFPDFSNRETGLWCDECLKSTAVSVPIKWNGKEGMQEIGRFTMCEEHDLDD